MLFQLPLGAAFKGTNYVQYDFKVADHKLSTFSANYVCISSVERKVHVITMYFI
jgi:hypothetical protein